MLKILRCALHAPHHEEIKEQLKSRTKKKLPSYLIVPEQATVLAEAEMSRELPDFAPLFFEVTNFTRFVNTAFRSLGGLAGEYCDKGRQALIMWRALTELSPALSATRARREITPSLVEAMLGAVSEIDNAGVMPAELVAACKSGAVTADGRLLGKLTDISKIYSLYKALLSEKYADPSGDVSEMIRRLRENPSFLVGTEIFIEGFTSFTESQYLIIGELAKRCEVTVHLPIPKARPDAFEYEEIRETERRLTSSARRVGADIKLISLDGRGSVPESIAELADYLWQSGTNVKIETASDEIRIFEATTTFEECDFIAADIKARIIRGAKYSDFAIIMRNTEKYDGLLDTALARAGIPIFSSKHTPLDEHEAIKLIYTALAVCRGGFRREDVIAFTKCGLSGVSAEACDEFEMYVNLWQINGTRFTDGAIWNMNPLGYSQRRLPDTDEKLVRIAKTKESVIAPLYRLSEKMKGLSTVREYATALYEFLASLSLADSLAARAKKLVELGESLAAEETARLWSLICNSLDTLVTVNGDTDTDLEGFIAQIKVLLASLSVSRIPSSSDSVTVGTADALRLTGKPHVYLIGVIAGEFPSTVKEASYFTEREKAVLSEAGLPIRPSLTEDSARELFIFSRALTYARESVTISYARTNTRYKRTDRGDVIDKIIKLTDGKISPVKISELSSGRKIYTPEDALISMEESHDGKAIREALELAGYERELALSDSSVENRNLRLSDAVTSEAFGGKIALTQSRIDSFVGCPLGHFCRYTVRLSEDKLAALDAPGIGSFIHAILENFFRALSDEGRGAGELSENERYELTMRAAKSYISSLGESSTEDNLRVRTKISRLCRAALPVVDGLCEEFSTSRFTPRFFELAIRGGDADTPSPVSIKTPDGTEISVYGIIDRVDTYKRGDDVFVRVIDYKTGKKDFSPEDLDEGKNLQMFLYLRSLMETKSEKFREKIGATEKSKILPAGVIYVKTSISDVKVDTHDEGEAQRAVKLAQEREGMVLDDSDVIDAMGARYTPAGTPGSDEISKRKKHLLYTEESFGALMDSVEKSVIRVAEGIKGGNIDASPQRSGSKVQCEYCEFKPICRAAEINK